MDWKTKTLTPEVLAIIQDKATETAFTGEYEAFDESGTYLCRRCGLAVFRAKDKFHSGCGWPSFDEEISAAVKRLPDQDGRRTEIVCARCDAHLGHVFYGEELTDKNTRHCVNSLSIDFVPDTEIKDTEEAMFAAGCFWGVEYLFKKLSGVLKTEVGYSGGDLDKPTYEQICKEYTGHYEVVRIIYEPKKICYEKLCQYFFEIHDPTQMDGQGPDHGHQYLSRIFYYNQEQKSIAEKLILQLECKGYTIVSKLLPASVFWRAENYHQAYYEKTGKVPYCHRYTKRFEE